MAKEGKKPMGKIVLIVVVVLVVVGGTRVHGRQQDHDDRSRIHSADGAV